MNTNELNLNYPQQSDEITAIESKLETKINKVKRFIKIEWVNWLMVFKFQIQNSSEDENFQKVTKNSL